MALKRISDYTTATTPLAGTEMLEVETAGGDARKVTAQDIADLAGTGGTLADGDYGDVAVSGSGTAIAIDAGAVTYAKMQDISATKRVLGRNTAGAGDAEEVSLTQLLDWIGSAADGDILYRSAGSWTRLGVGSDGQVLTLASGLPSWAAGSGASAAEDVSVADAGGYFGGTDAEAVLQEVGLVLDGLGPFLAGLGTAAWADTGDFLAPNTPITGATKTKITYDADGLVTAGADATTADIADSTNKRYVTDAQLTVIGNTSGTNTGDQTNITGNAGTATALQNARTIDGQSFDGTANITVIAPGTNAATGKTTPVDADSLPLVDSAASNVLKKLTWANVKATLKTYFDTLYQAVLVSGTNIKTINGASVLGSGDLTVSGGGSPAGSGTELQYRDGSSFGAMAGTAWDNTNRALTITGATVTTSNPLLNLTQTWNAGAVTFTGQKFNVTDTASAAESKFNDWQVDGVTKAELTKSGVFRSHGVYNQVAFGFTNDTDTGFGYRSANALNAIANGSEVFRFSTSGNYSFQVTLYIGFAADVSLSRAAANSLVFGSNTNVGAGAATTRTCMNKAVASIADNTATDVFTVTVPNAAHSASILVRLTGSLGAGGAIGANEATGTTEYLVSLSRTAGANVVAGISAAGMSSSASVSGGATITVTGDLGSVSGGASASNTFTIRVTVACGSGSSTNHTCLAYAELMNANASGVTIA